MIVEQIKKDIKQAMINKDQVTKDILRLVVGTLDQSDNKSDESTTSVISKMIKSNLDTISKMEGIEKYQSDQEKLKVENILLKKYLPQAYSKVEILNLLASNNINLSECKSKGQATGMIMKLLKTDGSKTIDYSIISELLDDQNSW